MLSGLERAPQQRAFIPVSIRTAVDCLAQVMYLLLQVPFEACGEVAETANPDAGPLQCGPVQQGQFCGIGIIVRCEGDAW